MYTFIKEYIYMYIVVWNNIIFLHAFLTAFYHGNLHSEDDSVILFIKI